MTEDVPDADGIPGKRSLRPLTGVLAAMAVSLTGTRISAVALPWFVLVTTGSATRTGLVAFCEMAPYVVVKAFTGPLVDRTGPRAVSWSTDLVSATAAAAVPLFHALHLLSFPLLLALVAVIGAARGPGDLAKEVMVPEAAERGGVPLERATGLPAWSSGSLPPSARRPAAPWWRCSAPWQDLSPTRAASPSDR